MPAASANGKPRRKRPSSLLAQASELPSVENSLDEFIARANETLVDASAFNTGQVRAAEDEARKEADALRWKAAEQQMRESGVREQSLRRQLDGLQGQLAEAEARAAVAGSGGSQDGVVADLKVRLSKADERLREAELRSQNLAHELNAAKTASQAAAAAVANDSLSEADSDELAQRARIAEAKAAKALAAARAAAAGLTVSAADLAAIESGLAVTDEPKKRMGWGGVIAAFIVGGAIMFAVAYVMLHKSSKPAASAGAQPPAPARVDDERGKQPKQPIVEPIEDEPKAAKAEEPKVEEPKVEEPKVEEPKVEEPKVEEPKAAKAEEPKVEEPKAKAEEPKAKAEEPKAEKKVATKKAPVKKAAAAPKKPAPKAEKKANSGALADPFAGGGEAPKKKKAAEKKPAGGGGIVDPF